MEMDMKYRIYAKVSGSKFIGEIEAANMDEAEEMAQRHENLCVSFCHHCAAECEDPMIDEVIVEPVTE